MKHFLIFPRILNLTFPANCCLWRQFALNVKSYFLGGKKKEENINFLSAEFAHRMLSVKVFILTLLNLTSCKVIYVYPHTNTATTMYYTY